MVPGLPGSSPTLKYSGMTVKDPERTLGQAEIQFRRELKAMTDSKQATISGDSRCYFVRPEAKSKDVTEQVACGPVRFLGVPLDNAWMLGSLEFKQSDDKVTASSTVSPGAQPFDEALLVRPDGKKPVKADSLPEPLAPEFPAKNAASLVTKTALNQVPFTDVTPSRRLIMPGGQVEITGSAELTKIPGEAGWAFSEGGDGGSPEFRPAAGQKVRAYQVKISPLADRGQAAPVANVESATATLGTSIGGRKGAVNVSPNLALNKSSSSSSSSYGSTPSPNKDGWQLPCQSTSDRDSYSYSSRGTYPCGTFTAIEAVLIVTHEESSPALLTASVNGVEQSLDLEKGEVKSSMTMVDYSRKGFHMAGPQRLDPGTITVTSKSMFFPATCQETTLQVDDIQLSGYDPDMSWAKPGRAWLTLVSKNEPLSNCSWKHDWPNIYVLSIGGKEQGAAWFDKSSHKRVIFDVPADFESGQFGWRPKGMYSSYPADIAYEAPRRATFDISIPK